MPPRWKQKVHNTNTFGGTTYNFPDDVSSTGVGINTTEGSTAGTCQVGSQILVLMRENTEHVTCNVVQPYVMDKAVYNPASGAMDLSAAGDC